MCQTLTSPVCWWLPTRLSTAHSAFKRQKWLWDEPARWSALRLVPSCQDNCMNFSGCPAYVVFQLYLDPSLEMLVLQLTSKDRVIKEWGVFSFLWTLIGFVGNITVSSSGTGCMNLISHRNLDPFKYFLVAQKCRNYWFDECRNSWISICAEVRMFVFVSLASANLHSVLWASEWEYRDPKLFSSELLYCLI